MSSIEPDHSSSEGGWQPGNCSSFVVTGSNDFELFELTEEILDEMPRFMGFSVKLEERLGRFDLGDYGRFARGEQRLTDPRLSGRPCRRSVHQRLFCAAWSSLWRDGCSTPAACARTGPGSRTESVDLVVISCDKELAVNNRRCREDGFADDRPAAPKNLPRGRIHSKDLRP